MSQEKSAIQTATATSKKAYKKPQVSQIRLVAEEAVLALCKFNNGVKSACVPNPVCSSQRRS